MAELLGECRWRPLAEPAMKRSQQGRIGVLIVRMLKVSLLPMIGLVLAACATASAGSPSLGAADYAAILPDPARTEADKKDDAARRPADVLAFAGIRPGATILEVEVGRGWYTEIL